MTVSTKKGGRGPAVRSIAGANPVRDSDTLALAQVAKTDARGAERLFGFLRNAVFLRLSPAALGRRDTPLVRGRGALLAACLFSMSLWTRSDHLNLVAYGATHALIPWVLLCADSVLNGPRPPITYRSLRSSTAWSPARGAQMDGLRLLTHGRLRLPGRDEALHG